MNTFSFSAVDDTDLPSIATAVITAYNGFRPNYAGIVRQNNHTIKFYDRSDPTPRAPRYEETWNFAAAPSGNALPTECSLCVSFQANQVSGIPQARRRGRVFMGPLNSNLNAATGRPTAGLVTAGVTFGSSILASSVAAADWEWVVWSTVNNAPYIITNGWVDDEFDTQRSRGRDATARTVW